MSVTNYTPQTEGARCKYSYNKLKKVLYLVSKQHTKDIHIDNGDAYIEDLTELPLRINGFNIQFNEESSLDERYKFTKTVTLSMHGYVNHMAFSGRYYVILEAQDGTYWMVNPDFPAKVTYTFNLSNNNYQTDFTFSLQSNYPTLRLLNNFEAVSPVCLGFNVKGIDRLRLLEKDYTLLDTENKIVYNYGKPFQDIEYLGNQCSLQETFNGETVTSTIEFDIALDAYKSSWHYNLLEFTQNLYAAIVTPKGNDNEFFVGYNFGLEPGFTVTSSSEQEGSDVITVRLVEMSSHGSTAASDWSEEQSTDTRWNYVKWVGTVMCYECVAQGTARYLVQQEMYPNGTPTGNYKCLEGYRTYYENQGLNIVGEFAATSTFNDNSCSGEICNMTTTIPNTITYTTTGCSSYTLSSTCDWNTEDVPNYITVTPSSGVANTQYNVNICNTQEITTDTYGSFNIKSGGNVKVVNVILSTGQGGGILNPTAHSINCLAQNVSFTYDPTCAISVTSIPQQLTYQINNTQLIVNVPRNYGSVLLHWEIGVRNCTGGTQTVHIYQDKTYESWVNADGYICVGSDSYSRQRRYTGTTASNLQPTDEYRAGTLIQSGDTRCTSSQTKWEWDNTSYYCVNGVKFKTVFEWIKYGDGQWTKTGATRLGDSVDDSTEHFCDQAVTYEWRLSTKWECTTGIKLIANYSDGKVNSVPCDGDETLTTGTTKPSGYTISAMTSAVIGNCVTTIGKHAFEGCDSLSSVTIGDGVTSIGSDAFSHCASLSSVTIPDSVTEIYPSVFYSCLNLSSINIPSGVTRLGAYCFYNCGILKSVVIPPGITTIEGSLFNNCTSLSSVTIPSGVTQIANSAFRGCPSLTTIDIPTGVTFIGSSAFNSCRSLTSVTIPSGVTSVETSAFRGCSSLTTIDIPSGVTEIKNYAFSGCSSLTSITVNALTPPTLGNNVFTNTNNCPIYVPCNSVEAYKAAENWSTYADRIQGIPPCDYFDGKFKANYDGGQTYSAECDSSTTLTSATTKPSGYPYTAMTSAEIGDCITSIGDYAFGHYYSLSACTSLSSVTIGSGVTKIGRNAFSWCSGLTSVVIPSGVTSIGYDVFYGCSSLTSVTIGNGVTFIDIQAFKGCSSLTSINIPSGVTEIAARAFEGCSSLTGITIPNNSQLTSISSWAFQRCSSLQSINIPSGVTGIGGYAFYSCTSLTSVTVNATTPPTLGEDAFTNTNDCAIYVPASSVEAYKTAWSTYASRIQPIT